MSDEDDDILYILGGVCVVIIIICIIFWKDIKLYIDSKKAVNGPLGGITTEDVAKEEIKAINETSKVENNIPIDVEIEEVKIPYINTNLIEIIKYFPSEQNDQTTNWNVANNDRLIQIGEIKLHSENDIIPSYSVHKIHYMSDELNNINNLDSHIMENNKSSTNWAKNVFDNDLNTYSDSKGKGKIQSIIMSLETTRKISKIELLNLKHGSKEPFVLKINLYNISHTKESDDMKELQRTNSKKMFYTLLDSRILDNQSPVYQVKK